MQGRGARLGDPVCPRTVRIADPESQILRYGRSEPRIREGFRLPLLAEATDVFVLHERQDRLCTPWQLPNSSKQNSNPRKRLDLLLQSPDSTHEGRAGFKSNTTLDSLYMSTLQEAFNDDDAEDDPNIRSVLRVVILVANPLSPSAMLFSY